MNKKARRQLIFGSLILIGVMAGLVIYMNKASAELASSSAVLRANTVTIGSDYAGTLTNQFVQPGDPVKRGDKLFELKSATLTQAINSGLVQEKDLPYVRTPSGEFIITASSDGYVRTLEYTKGSYVPNATKLGTIVSGDEITIEATYKMTPKQYAQTTSSTPLLVYLPGNKTGTASINTISIAEQGNPLIVTISAAMPSNIHYELAKAGQTGTPVETKLILHEHTIWNGLVGFRNRIGHIL